MVQLERTVMTKTEGGFPVGAKGDPHGPASLLEPRPDLRTASHVPQPAGVVYTAGQQAFAVRAKGHRPYPTRMG